MKEVIFEEKDLKKLKKFIKKNKYNNDTKLLFKYNNKLYDKPNSKLKEFNEYLEVIKVFNIKDRRARISYIYDYLCNYFDEDMKKNNYCEFKNDTCIANRLGYSVHKNNGCCYNRKIGLCPKLTDKGCSNPNPSCKIFMCEYLNKVKKIPNYDTKKIFLTNCFFSLKEHAFFRRHYFITKEEYLKKYFQKIKV
jgi:hypothetical protein